MTAPLGVDFSGRGEKSCLSFLRNCEANKSTQRYPISFQQGTRSHNGHSEMKETQDLLSLQFSKLSVQERSKAMDEIHCVGEELEETPEMIEQALKEFDQLVQTTANHTYDIAVDQNQSFVENRSFRLKFLRANVFNIRKSVAQMMGFLEYKALYFGVDKLTRDILPEDLGPEEMALMQTGFFQTMKDKDRGGRVVLYVSSFDRMPAECTIETLCRFFYYIVYHIILSISSVQTKGVVIIYNDESKGNSSHFPGLQFLTKATSHFMTLPIRAASLHVCLQSSSPGGSLSLHNQFGQLFFKLARSRLAARTRLHYGSDMERQYQLKSFGIPLDQFPVDKNGKIRTEIHQKWCATHLSDTIPSTNATSRQLPSHETNGAAPHNNNNNNNKVPRGNTSVLVRDTDVLLGRGNMAKYHYGNMQFRTFLGANANHYERLSPHERVATRIRFTQELLSNGTRFVRKQKGTGSWEVCDFVQAEAKVAQFFRTHRRDTRRT